MPCKNAQAVIDQFIFISTKNNYFHLFYYMSMMHYHYFFICPNYGDQRLVLLNYVSQITEPRLSYLLRGNYELSVNDNDKLFNHVQTFMQETTRFN